MKVALDTLGCKLNQAETEALAHRLAEAGHEVVSSVELADIYVLNTCTVTATADAKARHLLRMAHRRNPSAPLVAIGCYAERAGATLAGLPGVSLVVGNNGKDDLPHLLQGSEDAAGTTRGFAARTRAFIKVQDGCSARCAYCIVPRVRGPEKSVPLDRVLAEVNARAAEGFQEVVLTGTEVGSYRDGDSTIGHLLRAVLDRTAIARVRLSSLQPREVSWELVALWRNRRLCPHFHLSIQSGSDAVLGRMRRRYSVAEFRAAVERIRSVVPDAAITTDIIVGFPGETISEFVASLQACRELAFARIHVFPFSARPGTEAADMPGQVDENTKRTRANEMLRLARDSATAFKRRFAGKTRPVLWEQRNARGLWTGLTDNYIPVTCRADEDLTNRITEYRLE